MNNNKEECLEDECMQCSLVFEFREMVDDDVHWEDALRYVIHVASTVKDDEMNDIFSLGFEDGLKLGVEKASTLLNELVDYTDEQIAEYRAEREKELNEEAEEKSEEIEDISDEDFNKIAKIMREYQERNS